MDEPVTEARQAGKASPEPLDSWKAIAAYLRRDVTTVQRWERREGMPAARQAIELDPDLAEAHLVLANTQQEQWHWSQAESEYRRALAKGSLRVHPHFDPIRGDARFRSAVSGTSKTDSA